MNLRPRLTYANVAATMALVLALGGGTVYAAGQLGKNDVKSKNLAPGAVKTSDIAKNAVTGAKIKNKTIGLGDIATGVLQNATADVTASASGGPQASLNAAGTTPFALSGTTTFTPRAGQVSAVVAEGQFTVATANAGQYCAPTVRILVDGQETRIYLGPNGGNTATPVTELSRDADGPYGLISPGTPVTITAELEGDVDCTPGSTIDKIQVRVLQID